MSKWLHFVAGLLLGIIVAVFAVPAYSILTGRIGSITNAGFDTVIIQRQDDGPDSGEDVLIRKGETKEFDYGLFRITIPEAKASFDLFKINRGRCVIHSANGVPFVALNSDASIHGFE